MKKLLRILGCSKRKVTVLTKTAPSSKNNISSHIDNVNNSLSIHKDEINPNNENDDVKTVSKEEVSFEHSDINDLSIQEVEKQPKDQWLLPKDSPFITDYEKDVLEFTPNGLGAFEESLEQLQGFKTLYNKSGLVIDINMSGSPITSEFGLIKTVYKQKKSDLGSNANIPNILRLMFRAEDRMNWDKVLKLVKRYEGDDRMFIVRTWAISFPMVSERESVEKKMIFNYKGNPLVFSTSVKPDYIPEEKDVVRIINYLNIFKITEDEENFFFTTITQSDFKMPIPQFLMNFFLPKSTLDWFVKFQKVAAQTVLDPL